MSQALGLIFSDFDIRDYTAKYTEKLKNQPNEFELNIPRVKSQGKVGSCGAHALSCVVEYFNLVQHNLNVEMSTGYIYGNRKETNHKKSGLILRDALNTLRLYGDVPEEDFPYNIEMPEAANQFNSQFDMLYSKGYVSRISSYYRVKTVLEIKSSLKLGYPVVIGVKWYSDMTVNNGILTTNYQGYQGGHCMLIYGWNDKGWKVQNSWGKLWGDKGTCIIPFDMSINEAWAVVDNIKDGIELKKPLSSNKVQKITAKVINKIGNTKIQVENELKKLSKLKKK